MEKHIKQHVRRGLPGGPNELNKFTEAFIVSSNGQYDYPGQNTLIPNANGRITMKDVDYPVYGIDDEGNSQMMYPEEEYQFPGNSVYEIPMKKGGLVRMPKVEFTKKGKLKNAKKFSRSLQATNRLFTENTLFKKPKSKKRKVFDPNADYAEGGSLPKAEYGMPMGAGMSQNYQGRKKSLYPDGGIVQFNGVQYKKDKTGNWVFANSGAPVTDQMVLYKLPYEGKPVGSPVVQSAPKPKPISTVTKQQQLETIKNSPIIADQRKAYELQDEIRNENIYFPKAEPLEDGPEGIEGAVNSALGYPMAKAALSAESASNEGQVDNYRHANAGRYAAEAINDMTGNIPYLSDAAALLGANALGLGHEIGSWFEHSGEDTRPWTSKLRESGEDMYNNFVGTTVGISDMSPVEKTDKLLNLSYSNQLPDGIDNPNKPRPGTSNNMYFKHGPNDPGKYKSRYAQGGALLTKKVTCKKCGWKWDAADGGDDVTTCHKCGGQGLVHAQRGGDISIPTLNQMKEGGVIETELTADEIEEYRRTGWIVETM